MNIYLELPHWPRPSICKVEDDCGKPLLVPLLRRRAAAGKILFLVLLASPRARSFHVPPAPLRATLFLVPPAPLRAGFFLVRPAPLRAGFCFVLLAPPRAGLLHVPPAPLRARLSSPGVRPGGEQIRRGAAWPSPCHAKRLQARGPCQILPRQKDAAGTPIGRNFRTA